MSTPETRHGTTPRPDLEACTEAQRDAGAKAKDLEREKQLLESMLHELKAPLTTAYRYADILQKEAEPHPNLQPTIAKLLLVLKRTRMVSSRFRFLLSENKGSPFAATQPQSMSPQQLLGIVTTCVSDIAAVYTRPASHLTWSIDKASFEATTTPQFKADPGLLEQALFNILENACKYSYPNSQIRIALREAAGKITIDVLNKGLPLSQTDAEHATQLGWRGESARMMTVDGAGIGLWVASRIAAAHGGALTVRPTDAHGINRISLTIAA